MKNAGVVYDDSHCEFAYFGSQKKILTRMMTRQEETNAAQQRKVTGSRGGILSLPVWPGHCSPLLSWPAGGGGGGRVFLSVPQRQLFTISVSLTHFGWLIS